MGTWSQPLFARVSHGIPEDYVLDVSDWPAEILHAWRHAAFLGEDTTKTGWNLSEFMNTGCDTHKILDHLDLGQRLRWYHLMTTLMEKYPVLEWIQFHFYSSDAQFAYCLELRKGGEKPTLRLRQALKEHNPQFYRAQRTWSQWLRREETETVFEVEEYKARLDTAAFTDIDLSPHKLKPSPLDFMWGSAGLGKLLEVTRI